MPEHTPAPTPARAVYGFVLYLASVTSAALFLLWAYVPPDVASSLGLRCAATCTSGGRAADSRGVELGRRCLAESRPEVCQARGASTAGVVVWWTLVEHVFMFRQKCKIVLKAIDKGCLV
ncbi:uncharacterized protein LOC124719961 isoform X2 [Schistocerca piceifrons]|uniref:uncharacterized protein LOC124719961 isoform X2 n=1 Tax=Schistocerca piceifrons TaxID=274613 RepID=UPI001F5F2873|nr:uncharacterized protein LOC124719961 isoform X2 [Schistocerca piceifrons]